VTTTPLHVLPSPEAIGDQLSTRLRALFERARMQRRQFLLGCPTGRTPRPIFAALAHGVAMGGDDLRHVVLVMMDEYLVRDGAALAYAPAAAPWSCHHFAAVEIAGRLNAGLPPARRLREESVWFPDPRDPEAYDARIADAGGIDLFLLASGASDGHVAFNPPGSPRTSRTRIVELSEETRRDNLRTFPSFGSLDAVPHHGVGVGIATIAAAKRAVMVVWGAGKRLTLSRMLGASRYEPDWPATVIHECPIREILSDGEALGPRPGSASGPSTGTLAGMRNEE
jgi:glucosamine-6-phosphate deaminase